MLQLNSTAALAWSVNSNGPAMGILVGIKSTLASSARLRTLMLHITRAPLVCNGTASELDTDSIMGSLWIRSVPLPTCFLVFSHPPAWIHTLPVHYCFGPGCVPTWWMPLCRQVSGSTHTDLCAGLTCSPVHCLQMAVWHGAMMASRWVGHGRELKAFFFSSSHPAEGDDGNTNWHDWRQGRLWKEKGGKKKIIRKQQRTNVAHVWNICN